MGYPCFRLHFGTPCFLQWRDERLNVEEEHVAVLIHGIGPQALDHERMRPGSGMGAVADVVPHSVLRALVVVRVVLEVVQPPLCSVADGRHVAVAQAPKQVHGWVGHALSGVARVLVAGAQHLLRLQAL